MNAKYLSVLAFLVVPLAAAGDVRVTIEYTVTTLDSFNGAPFPVALGDPLTLSFEVLTPGNEIFPQLSTEYDLDPATFSIETTAPTGLQLNGPARLTLLDDGGIGMFDGFNLTTSGLNGQIHLSASGGMSASFLDGNHLYQNLGDHPLGPGFQWGALSMFGAGWSLGGTGVEIRIEGVPITDTFCVPAQPNSTGAPARLSGARLDTPGSGVHLEVDQGPPGAVGFLVVGNAVSTPGILVDQGLLCIASGPGQVVGRYNVHGTERNSLGRFDSQGRWLNVAGTSALAYGFDLPTTLPLSGTPAIQTGQTWHFQMWYRDQGGHSNLSNGLSVSF
ncbi:MAG: hypothetical protein ACI80K_003300 [Paracoccaceae bacterium]|jgi:hypothetical protein